MKFSGFRVENVGLRSQVFLDFKGQGSGNNIQDSGLMVSDSIEGVKFLVWG